MISGCASTKTSTAVNDKTSLNVPSLAWKDNCDNNFAGKTYVPTNKSGNQLGPIFSILGTALVTKGVDLVGEQLKSASEEKTRTASAIYNVTEDQNVGCLVLSRGTDFEFKLFLKPIPGKPEYIEPILLEYSYKKSIDGKSRGERGLTLTFEVSRPGTTNKSTQTLNLGNLDVGSSNDKLTKSAPIIANPFIIAPTAKDKENGDDFGNGIPFTMSMTLTEVKNANAFLKFTNDTFESSNDDLTTAILTAIGLSEDDEDAPDDATAAAAEVSNGGQ